MSNMTAKTMTEIETLTEIVEQELTDCNVAETLKRVRKLATSLGIKNNGLSTCRLDEDTVEVWDDNRYDGGPNGLYTCNLWDKRAQNNEVKARYILGLVIRATN